MFHGRPGFARMAAVAVAGVSCLAVAACGGTTASSSSNAAGAGSTTSDPLASLTASAVVTQALANLKAATTLTMTGAIKDAGKNEALNLGLKPGQGCEGTIEENGGGTIKLIMIGKTIYINPDNQYWKSQGGTSASSIIALVNGRYIKTSTTANGMSSMADVCNLSRQLASEKVTGTFTKGKLTTLGGTRVLPLVSAKDGVLYVTDTSKPEIVEMDKTKDTGDGTGKLTFSVGAPVTLTPPPTTQVLDGSSIGM